MITFNKKIVFQEFKFLSFSIWAFLRKNDILKEKFWEYKIFVSIIIK